MFVQWICFLDFVPSWTSNKKNSCLSFFFPKKVVVSCCWYFFFLNTNYCRGGGDAVQIVQRHHFASHLKRMAVVVRVQEQFFAFVKVWCLVPSYLALLDWMRSRVSWSEWRHWNNSKGQLVKRQVMYGLIMQGL